MIKEFDINRLNFQKLKLGENILHLNNYSYKEVKHNNNNLIDENNDVIGTKGDMYTKIILDNILQDGTLDKNPRPRYEDYYKNAKYNIKRNVIITEDGYEIKLAVNDKIEKLKDGIKLYTPAHTLSVNSKIECNYDLSKGESPLITLRPIATKASIAEILWIYQKASNDLIEFDELLEKNTWDVNHEINNWWKDWALKDDKGNYILNEKGHPTIGSCYGETVRKHNILKEEVINAIKNNPDGRRNITSLWQQDDFNDPHGLKPCAFLTIWNVRHGWDNNDYLDMTMVQRSSDFATAGCINQVQYVILQQMIARELDLIPGIFTWKPINVQIYDRHINQAIELLNREPINCNPKIELNNNIKYFDDFTVNDVQIKDYPIEKIKTKNKQLKFPLGI